MSYNSSTDGSTRCLWSLGSCRRVLYCEPLHTPAGSTRSFLTVALVSRELPEGIVNLATPLLDLSNLFGVEEGEGETALKADFNGNNND